MFARVAVNVSAISDLFDYSIPAELAPQIQAGCLVTVPFGNQTVQGIIIELLDSPSVANPKPILDLLDPAPVLTPPQLGLAIRLAESTLNPLASIINLMLPTGLSQQADIQYSVINKQSSVISEQSSVVSEQSPVAKRLLGLLKERGALRGRQIDTHFAKIEIGRAHV